MRQFYETYPEITSALLTQLSQTHRYILISCCKTKEERLFYLQLTATERHSTRELHCQINSRTFEHTRLQVSNSDLVIDSLLSHTLTIDNKYLPSDCSKIGLK
jgi:predicted nuclease of restriction endonuclease-like (RecB) superfamily